MRTVKLRLEMDVCKSKGVVMSEIKTLDEFVDELIRLSNQAGYDPKAFRQMRARLGTVEAIKRLVIAGEIQSGFTRLKELGLLEWSLEAAVLKFPTEFTSEYEEAAKWRLDQAKEND